MDDIKEEEVSFMPIPGDFIRNWFGVVGGGHYERYKEFGARWNRIDLCIWQVLEGGAAAVLAEQDEQVRMIQSHGITPLLILDGNYTPPWATEEGVGFFPPKAVEQLREGVEAVVSRYAQPPFNLTFFEVSNEPNIAWFWRTRNPEEVHEEYIDKVLIPTAEIVHKYGGKVVAPAITMEWPDNCWPVREWPTRKCFNVGWCIKAVQDWLLYNDAWKHIDYFALHYTKGDTEKLQFPYAENLMPLYDYLYENWVKPGKIEGIWNTEEGLTAVEAGTSFISLEPWEVAPYGQWVPKYSIPVIHWAISKGWRHRDQYKLFWFQIDNPDVLGPTSLVAREYPQEILETGKAMGTLVELFADAGTVDVYNGSVTVGFGLHSQDTTAMNYFAPYKLENYAFTVDGDILVAAWMDLPGLETTGPSIQAVVKGMETSRPVSSVVGINYLTGKEEPVSFAWDGDSLQIELPRKPDPVIYFRVRR